MDLPPVPLPAVKSPPCSSSRHPDAATQHHMCVDCSIRIKQSGESILSPDCCQHGCAGSAPTEKHAACLDFTLINPCGAPHAAQLNGFEAEWTCGLYALPSPLEPSLRAAGHAVCYAAMCRLLFATWCVLHVVCRLPSAVCCAAVLLCCCVLCCCVLYAVCCELCAACCVLRLCAPHPRSPITTTPSVCFCIPPPPPHPTPPTTTDTVPHPRSPHHPHLAHEAGDDSVEGAALVAKPGVAALTQLLEVLSSLGHNILLQALAGGEWSGKRVSGVERLCPYIDNWRISLALQ
jgi:hypothetical protein